MSPYPAQIDRERILSTAREMIEAEGVDHLSLNKLAAALGVRAPSLYGHVASKGDLLRALNEQTIRQLFEAMNVASDTAGDDPERRLLEVARAYRDFASANPVRYGLAFTNTMPQLQPDAGELERLALPLQRLMAHISGEAHSLVALRGVWALIHGFVTLELGGQFRRGGDLSETYAQAVRTYLGGWLRGA